MTRESVVLLGFVLQMLVNCDSFIAPFLSRANLSSALSVDSFLG
jgi:hypothetical protein